MHHGSNGRTMMTSLKLARRAVGGSETVTEIKRMANKTFRQRVKQKLAHAVDYDEVDLNMNPTEYDTAWKAY